ncbi:uncharacterized protein LOC106468177 [Limulus polyphemus]|uniref:Uncharacterized protein LOC106468177 n=1 Tax=Limulus polyphemus TaxID=6850 RepID=A0ABM1T8I3_LIMPO|nr:uncharacterized protein LOC106468177 [Limulus polyphemus]
MSSTTPYSYILSLLILLTATDSLGLKITEVSIPHYIENGTKESVILDCRYDYGNDDKNLVVKWFLNDDPEPIYQWITELNLRQPSYRLQGRINMSYTVTPSANLTRYRALNILRPTTDLSGKYTCNVASLASEDSEERQMTIYAPPRSFNFNYTKTDRESSNFTCVVEGIFPEPQISLLLTNPNLKSAKSIPLHNKTIFSKGTYSVMSYRELLDKELPSGGPSELQCVLFIPGTDFRREKILSYYPEHLAGSALRFFPFWSTSLITAAVLLVSTVPNFIYIS